MHRGLLIEVVMKWEARWCCGGEWGADLGLGDKADAAGLFHEIAVDAALAIWRKPY